MWKIQSRLSKDAAAKLPHSCPREWMDCETFPRMEFERINEELRWLDQNIKAFEYRSVFECND